MDELVATVINTDLGNKSNRFLSGIVNSNPHVSFEDYQKLSEEERDQILKDNVIAEQIPTNINGLYHFTLMASINSNPETDIIVAQVPANLRETIMTMTSVVEVLDEAEVIKRKASKHSVDPILRDYHVEIDRLSFPRTPRPETSKTLTDSTVVNISKEEEKDFILFDNSLDILSDLFINNPLQYLTLPEFERLYAERLLNKQDWLTSVQHRNEINLEFSRIRNLIETIQRIQLFEYLLSTIDPTPYQLYSRDTNLHSELINNIRNKDQNEIYQIYSLLVDNNSRNDLWWIRYEKVRKERGIAYIKLVENMKEKLDLIDISGSDIHRHLKELVYPTTIEVHDLTGRGSGFSAQIQQKTTDGVLLYHQVIFPMQEAEFPNILFHALTQPRSGGTDFYNNINRGIIPEDVVVTAERQVPFSTIFFSPSKGNWGMSLVLQNPRIELDPNVDTKEFEVKHREFINSLKRKQ